MSISALIWFLIGIAVAMVSRVEAIHHAKNNTATRGQIWNERGVSMALRGITCIAIFVLWLQGGLADMLMAASIPLPETAKHILDLHLVGAMGFPIGLAGDHLLGFIPIFSSTLPPPADQEAANEAMQSKGFAKGVDAAAKAASEVEPPPVGGGK